MSGNACKIYICPTGRVLAKAWNKLLAFVWASESYQPSTRYPATFVVTMCLLVHKFFNFQIALKHSYSSTLQQSSLVFLHYPSSSVYLSTDGSVAVFRRNCAAATLISWDVTNSCTLPTNPLPQSVPGLLMTFWPQNKWNYVIFTRLWFVIVVLSLYRWGENSLVGLSYCCVCYCCMSYCCVS
jgi:hypothetical protein